jgi:TonB family protein
MKKTIFISCLMSIIIGCNAQKKAGSYYQKGIKYSKQNNFVAAENMFLRSIESYPGSESYYELAKLYKANNKCSYCKYLELSIIYGNYDVMDNYYSSCQICDTTIFKNNQYNSKINREYSCLITNDCNNEKIRTYIIEEDKNIKYSFLTIDSKGEIENVIPNTFPDIDENNKNFVFNKPDELPEYIGGDEARIQFLEENMKYPKISKEIGKMGIVMLTFIIDETGNIQYPRVKISADKYLDEEALRVIKLMPKWKPGKVKGKNVKVIFNMPVRFTLT